MCPKPRPLLSSSNRPPRPLTHDLIRNLLNGLSVKLQRVTVSDLRNNTYFALLSLEFRGQTLEIDSRSSDAIAVALRMKAPIYATTEVLAKAKPLPAPSSRGEQVRQRPGLQVQDLTAELAALLDLSSQRGVLVADVATGSPPSSRRSPTAGGLTYQGQRPSASIRRGPGRGS